MESDYEVRPINFRRDMDAITDLIDVAFGTELAVEGTDIRTEFRMLKKLIPVISILQIFSETFRHVFDGFAIEDRGRMVALVNVSKVAPKSKRWVIGNVATHPDYRRKGLARKLVTRAIEHAKQQGADMCTLEVRSVNTPAYNLYRNLGFEHYDSISELKLEILPLVEAIPLDGYAMHPMKVGEWESRYELARQETPTVVQTFLPVSKDEYKLSGIEKVFYPIFMRAQRRNDFRSAFKKDGQLSGYLVVSARRADKVTHRINMRILPEHRAALMRPMVSMALERLQDYPKNNTLISVRSSYTDLLDLLKQYGFVVYDEMHRLGLKLN